MEEVEEVKEVKEVNIDSIDLVEDNFKEIVFFGCWNDGYCPSRGINNKREGQELTYTMDALKTYIEHNKNNIVDVIVAGDNYYQTKEKKPKDNNTEPKKTDKKITINEKKFKSGFKCLKDAVGDIPTTILLGNHDVKYIGKNLTIIKDENGSIITTTNEKDPCSTSIIEKQIVNNLNIVNEPEKFHLFNFNNVDENYKLYPTQTPHTIIIMIDSSIFDDKDETFCYKHFDKELDAELDNKIFDAENAEELRKKFIQSTIINKQKDFMNTIVNKLKEQQQLHPIHPIQNIIFTAHHPIIGIKINKLDIMKKFTEYIYDFCIEIQEQVNADVKFYHLCADVHNFQIVDIELNKNNKIITIRQYVVGTGGAENDKFEGFSTLENYNLVVKTKDLLSPNKFPTIVNMGESFTHSDYEGKIIENENDTFLIKFKQWGYSVTNGFLTLKIPNSANDDIEFYFHSNPNTTIIRENEEFDKKGGANKKRRLSKKTNKRKSTMKKNRRRPSALKRRRSLRKHFHTRKY